MKHAHAGRLRSSWCLDTVAIFALAVLLVAPLFRVYYRDAWHSIESTFIADGRFLKDHWPSPRWQPLWYCGTRYDYIYPPAIRYGTASLAKILGVTPARAYHIYTAFLYALGIAAVYLFARTGTGSRAWGWLAAAAAATVSPGLYLIGPMRADAEGYYSLPQRLHVLLRYGEGPHISAVSVLPLALAATWLALERRRPGMLALAALFSALVVSHNFYGATALAILYPLAVWARFVTQPRREVLLRAAAIPVLAYGLTAFWLTPSYVRITLANMRLVSQPGNRWSLGVALGVAALFAWMSWRAGRRYPERAWTIFVAGAAIFMTLDVVGNHYLGFRVMGEPLRLVPELDLIYILLAISVLGWLLRRRIERPRLLALAPQVLAALILIAACVPALRYLRQAWKPYTRDEHPERRIEYRLTDWLARNLPGERILVSGSLRFWFNTWHDLAQVGGGSDQGVLNQSSVAALWVVVHDPDPEWALQWLQAAGAGAVVVHDERSQEIYHDFPHPRKFDGRLQVIYDSGAGDRIYRVPRRFPGLARVVEAARMEKIRPLLEYPDRENVRAYVDVVERGPDKRVQWRREGLEAIRLSTTLAPGEAVLVQESYDPYWRAYSGGRRLPVRPDPMGFLLIEAPPGDHTIHLVFELPLENRIGRVASTLTVGLLAVLCLSARRRVTAAK